MYYFPMGDNQFVREIIPHLLRLAFFAISPHKKCTCFFAQHSACARAIDVIYLDVIHIDEICVPGVVENNIWKSLWNDRSFRF